MNQTVHQTPTESDQFEMKSNTVHIHKYVKAGWIIYYFLPSGCTTVTFI